jgi:hypothetical protein
MLKNIIMLTAVATCLLISMTASAQGPQYFYYCTYGGGVEPRYVTDIFAADFHDNNQHQKNKKEFENIVKKTFTLHPNFEIYNYYALCDGFDNKQKAVAALPSHLKRMNSSGIKQIFLTKWQPGKLAIDQSLYTK